AGRLVVRRRERAREAARLHAVRRRLWGVPGRGRRGGARRLPRIAYVWGRGCRHGRRTGACMSDAVVERLREQGVDTLIVAGCDTYGVMRGKRLTIEQDGRGFGP